MHGLVTLPFGDDEYAFRLPLSGIAAIEEKFDKSIFLIVAGLQLKNAKSTEVLEVIREGLVGGGMDHVAAMKLVRRYGDELPLFVTCALAYQIGLAGLRRVHSRELEEPPGEPTAPATSPSDSMSAPFSDLPPS